MSAIAGAAVERWLARTICLRGAEAGQMNHGHLRLLSPEQKGCQPVPKHSSPFLRHAGVVMKL